jgi:hypothetical protein
VITKACFTILSYTLGNIYKIKFNIFRLAVGIAVYMMNSSPVCVLLYFCVHWMFLQVIHRLESHF